MRKLTAILTLLCLCVSVYAGKLIPNGSTSQSISVVINDADGDPNTGITIANLDLYVTRDGAFSEATKIDLVALGTVTTAWTSGRAIHKGRGLYRIDIPDANMSDGAGVMLTYSIVDAVQDNRTSFYEVQLETATIAAILADTGELQVDWTDGGRLDLILDIINVNAAKDGRYNVNLESFVRPEIYRKPESKGVKT